MRNQVASSGRESPDESRREQRELSGSARKAVGWGRTAGSSDTFDLLCDCESSLSGVQPHL